MLMNSNMHCMLEHCAEICMYSINPKPPSDYGNCLSFFLSFFLYRDKLKRISVSFMGSGDAIVLLSLSIFLAPTTVTDSYSTFLSLHHYLFPSPALLHTCVHTHQHPTSL